MPPSAPTVPNDAAVRHGPALLESWLRLAKAFALYPPTHERVTATIASFRTKLAAAAEALEATTVTIGFGGGRTWLNGRDAGEDPGNWLRERLDAARLAAVAFAHDIPAESLSALSRRLLEISAARSDAPADFGELWPIPLPGLDLVERRFEGRFDENAGASGAPFGGPGSGVLDTRDVSGIANRLADDERIGALLATLERITANGEEGLVRVDVVGRLLKLLPADTRSNEDASREAVRAALATLVEKASRLPAAEGVAEADRQSLADLLLAVRSGLFGREFATTEAPPREVPDRTRDHRRREDPASTCEVRTPSHAPAVAARGSDDAIEDDPERFNAERLALPNGAPLDLAADERTREAEQIATALALFLSETDADTGERLGANLIALLERGTERSIGMIGALLGDLDRPAAGMDRLVGLLRSRGQARILKCCRFLDAKAALDRFPRHFGLFLDTWDPGSSVDHSELGGICRELGRARILAAASSLVDHERLGAHAVALCARAPLDAAPLVEVLVAGGDEAVRRAALAFVRRIPLDETLARPLWIVDETAALPVPVLRGLLSIAAGDAEPPSLRAELGAVLVDFIEATATRPSSRARRLYAIANLPAYPSPRTRSFLHSLAFGWRRFVPFLRKAADLRRAAKTALAALPGL